jgi:hypothetical protein
MKTVLSVYLDNGELLEYYVPSGQELESIQGINENGYIHTRNGDACSEWYPPHRIQKVIFARVSKVRPLRPAGFLSIDASDAG